MKGGYFIMVVLQEYITLPMMQNIGEELKYNS